MLDTQYLLRDYGTAIYETNFRAKGQNEGSIYPIFHRINVLYGYHGHSIRPHKVCMNASKSSTLRLRTEEPAFRIRFTSTKFR